MIEFMGSWMLFPFRKANWAGSRREGGAILEPRRLARSLLTRRPMIGPTDIGRRLSVLWCMPYFFGIAVTTLVFSVEGRSFVIMHSLTILVSIRSPLKGVWVRVGGNVGGGEA